MRETSSESERLCAYVNGNWGHDRMPGLIKRNGKWRMSTTQFAMKKRFAVVYGEAIRAAVWKWEVTLLDLRQERKDLKHIAGRRILPISQACR